MFMVNDFGRIDSSYINLTMGHESEVGLLGEGGYHVCLTTPWLGKG